MEISKSILLSSLVLLAVVTKETKIQVEGTATEKDDTCIQQGNCEGERTFDDHDLYHLDQVTDGDIEGYEENMDRSLFGFDHFGSSELKTDDAVQRSPPKAEDALLPTYEYPKLTRRDPGKAGNTQEVEYLPGKVLKLITRAVHPPIFEIPEFLTPEECDIIIQTAKNVGLKRSGVFGDDVEEELKTKNAADVSRISNQTWLTMAELGDIGASLINKVASIAQLPTAVIERSEKLQVAINYTLNILDSFTCTHENLYMNASKGNVIPKVVSYSEGGHYHAHLDSSKTHASDDDEKDPSDIPCCLQTKNCGDVVETPEWDNCCRLCRYITVMYYLSDVPAGGETAFPLVDLPEDKYQAILENEDHDWSNLSYYCYSASFILRPKKGTAIMWYNHHVDPETGYLGLIDERSYHGGCDILKGSKWIANTWISTPPYHDRFKPSLHYTGSGH